MDRVREGDETRNLAMDPGYARIASPKGDREVTQEYTHKPRNGIERAVRRLKRFHRVFPCYDKLDLSPEDNRPGREFFSAFTPLVPIFDPTFRFV